MKSASTCDSVAPAADRLDLVKSAMAGKIREALVRQANKKGSRNGGILRVKVAAPPINLPQWLAAQLQETKTYWADRDAGFEMAGIGAADIVSSDSPVDYAETFRVLRRRLCEGERELRYYGGFRFDGRLPGAARDKAWRKFGTCRFLIPRFELYSEGGRAYFACNLAPNRGADALTEALEELDRVVFDAPQRAFAVPAIAARRHTPDKEAWRRIVETVQAALEREELAKLVLARETAWEFRGNLDPVGVSARLKKVAGACFHFCFQLGDSLSFVGVTPELLYRREEDKIETEAIAGTRPRRGTAQADRALSRELITSKKERREHQYVVENVEEALGRLCSAFRKNGETSVLKLVGVQHLICKFNGDLRRGVTDARILETLHPTSAVGGSPTAAAIAKLRELEPFDRGWYAGPIGWVGKDSACMAVAIRSCLTEGRKLRAYSAAGVINGSTPDGEWDELESKVESFAGSLGL